MNARPTESMARRHLRVPPAWALAAVTLFAGCGHDWSPAGDADTAADTDGELGDTPFDGDTPETPDTDSADDAVATDDAPTEDVAPDDVAPDDAPPAECNDDPDCDDGNPCTLDLCDLDSLRCSSTLLADDSSCGVGALCCSGSCVSSSDVAHCGRCGNVCPGAPHAAPVCDPSGCGIACEDGYLDCEMLVADGCETVPAEDEQHCGSCTVGCSDAETCVAGSCEPSWRGLSDTSAPWARRYVQGFWTGTEFLIFGGHSSGGCASSPWMYDPVGNSWRHGADGAGTITGCTRAALAWSGSLLLVWGGADGSGDVTGEPGGGRYDPVADSWTSISFLGDPADRMSAATVWTGTEMIVWGGAQNPSSLLSDGGRYAPASDHWTPVTSVGAPSARWGASAVWTGTEMLVWGGFLDDAGTPSNSGGRYDPSSDSWRPMSSAGAPAARGAVPAVWTGSEMLVWGGAGDAAFGLGYYSPQGDGAAYDPASDSWRPLGASGLEARHSHAAVWIGGAMLVWGGTRDYVMSAFGNGAMYDPVTDDWTAITRSGAPQGRRSFAYAWSGSEFLVWGGADQVAAVVTNLDDGGAYRPR